MNLNNLAQTAASKEMFTTVQDYVDFSLRFLEYIETKKQAEIVAQNEHRYKFFQFNHEAEFKFKQTV